MAKKVVVIFGGPRKESNTHMLVKEAMKGLGENGAKCETFFLNDLSIRGCQSCKYCKANNTTDCAVRDDMIKVHKAMEQADGILVASPVFFGSATAPTKMWIERLYPYLGPGHNLPGSKRIGFIFTQNHPDAKMFEGNLATFMGMTRMAGLVPAGHLVASNLSKGDKPMVTENPQYMQAAYELGKNLLP